MLEPVRVHGNDFQQPVEHRLTEVSPVELVAELVQVVLKIFLLRAVIRVQQLRLAVADDRMHPREVLLGILVRDHLLRMVGIGSLKGRMRMAHVHRDMHVRLHALHRVTENRAHLEVGNHQHLDVTHLLGLPASLRLLHLLGFGHDKHLGLALRA